MKTCTKCKCPKRRDEFVIARARKDGLHSWCRKCFNESNREKHLADPESSRRRVRAWRGRNLEAERARVNTWFRDPSNQGFVRDSQLKTKFGIGLAEYDVLFKAQKGRCALNRTTEPGGRWHMFAVDHEHVDNWKEMAGQDRRKHLRGLLCHGCNSGLGLFKENPALLSGLTIRYLRQRPFVHLAKQAR